MDHYAPRSGFLTAGSAAPMVDIDATMKYWTYATQLARYMYEVCKLN